MGSRSGLTDLVGRTIVAVTVKESERPPHHLLILTLDNGTYYEIWSEEAGLGVGSMTCKGGLDEARGQGRADSDIVFEVLRSEAGEPVQTAGAETGDRIELRKSLRGPYREP